LGSVTSLLAVAVTPAGSGLIPLLQLAPLTRRLPLATLFVTATFVSGSRSHAHA
jgi:hypothetical protein